MSETTDRDVRDVLMFEAGMREPRPLNAVDQLAIQTSYASVRFIAAHLRKYFEHCDDNEYAEPWIPRTLLDAAERTARVLDQMRQGDQQQWGHIAETMTRAAFAIDDLMSNARVFGMRSDMARETAAELHEAVEWMRTGGDA